MSLSKQFLADDAECIIPSLLYADFYKLTMLQLFCNNFPTVQSKYVVKVRTDYDYAPHIDQINTQLDMLCKLTFTQDELNWLKKIRFFKPTFIDYLNGYQLKRQYVHASVESGVFTCYAEGPITQVSMFEIYVLVILQQIRSNNVLYDTHFDDGKSVLENNITKIKEYTQTNAFKFADFSCRRSASVAWLDYVVSRLVNEFDNKIFTGTSCMYYAMKYNITAIGTEYIESLRPLKLWMYSLALLLFNFKGRLP